MQLTYIKAFLDVVINNLYSLSFAHLLVLVLLEVELTLKRLSAIRVFVKSDSY